MLFPHRKDGHWSLLAYVGDRGPVLWVLGWALTRICNLSMVLDSSTQESWTVVGVEHSHEFFTDIRGRGGVSNLCFYLWMSPSHRQTVKCVFIYVQSKLSISRSSDKPEPRLTLRVALNNRWPRLIWGMVVVRTLPTVSVYRCLHCVAILVHEYIIND